MERIYGERAQINHLSIPVTFCHCTDENSFYALKFKLILVRRLLKLSVAARDLLRASCKQSLKLFIVVPNVVMWMTTL